MKLAMIGLGRMGGNMVERLMRDTGETASKVPRYKATVRIIHNGAAVADAPERHPLRLDAQFHLFFSDAQVGARVPH